MLATSLGVTTAHATTKARHHADPTHAVRTPDSVPSSTKASAHQPIARADAHVTKAESLSVVARPYRSATVTVGANMIANAIPGTNPMKVLGALPGVMFQSNDPQGLDNWSAQLMMHGFQQQEVGMTLDGIPLGEMSYRNYNGLNPLQAISSENVGRMDVSRSAGAETVAATNNLGGSIEYISLDPKDKLGGNIVQTFGSNDLYHTFLRFDSGKLTPSGTKFFVSYMRNDAGMWKGYGEQFLQQVNAKFVQPLGERSKISAFFNWSDLHQNTYDDYSFEMLDKLGYNQNYYQNGGVSGYQTAINAAKGIYTPRIATLSDPLDAAYYSGGTNNTDYLGGLTADLALTERLRWTSTIYGHNQQNQTTWVSPYWPSPNGSPLSDIVKQPEILRFGMLSSLRYNIAHNDLGVGVWYENNHYLSPMYSYSEPNLVDGVLSGPLVNDLDYFSHPFAKIFSQTYNTNTFTTFFQDTYHPVRNVDLHFGFKSLLNTTRVGDGYLNPDYYGSTAPITSGVGQTIVKPFLPHIGLAWRFLPGHELFADISENVHTYAQSGYKLSTSPFSVLQSAYDASVKTLRPQTAWTYAVGYRYTDHLIAATLYAYRTNFENRLQQVTSGSLINPVSSVANVGGVTMNGVDAGLTIRPVSGLEFYNSVSYDHATYDQNLTSLGVIYAIKGQQVVNYPRFMYKTRLSYNWSGASIWIDATRMGSRNFSYVGDSKAPAYWLANLGVDYRFDHIGQKIHNLNFVQNLVLSLTISNLASTRYISTMGENGNPLSNATGAYSYQSFLLGAPRQFFGSIKAEF